MEDDDIYDNLLKQGFLKREKDIEINRQIKKASWVSEQRKKNHLLYAELLEGVVEFQDWGEHNPVSISFGALARSKEHRTEIVNRLVENGIETRIFSAGNLGLHPFWTKRYGAFEDEMSNRIHSCGFFVPNYPELTEDEVKFICNIIRG